MSMPVNQSLTGNAWQFRLVHVHPKELGTTHDQSEAPSDLIGRDVPATVPGQVHVDLLREGLIVDPTIGLNEKQVLWTGRADWTYQTTLAVDQATLDHEHVELCFDGLDTFAEVVVNGTTIGRTRNMHRRYRLDAKAALHLGDNDLTVRFAAPLPEIWQAEERQGPLPRQGGGSNPTQPHNAVRKMSCDMGWDWGPATPTSGIWRDVRLEAWSTGRLGDVRPIVTSAMDNEATVAIHADVEGRGTATAKLTSPDGVVFESKDGVITVDEPQLWWPWTHGDQPLYDLQVELHDGHAVLDRRTHRIGLRTVELITDSDADDAQWPVDGIANGSRMELRINGRSVYCKGANWIPDDVYPARVDRDRYRERLKQAASANMNMVRIWGGGLYESDGFYELCDEMGLMVWQDFLFACAAYSELDEVADEVEAEARDNVSRLCRHPSLVLFNGNNENLWGHRDWHFRGQSWPDSIGSRGWGAKYYFDVLPSAVADLAPGVPYWPGSPSNGGTLADFERTDRHPNDNEHGNRHIWNVWHGPGHYLGYVGHSPRFCSEFGFHGQPTWPAIEQSVPEDQRRWYSPTMRSHNKNGYDGTIGDGQDKSTTRLSDDFLVPDDFDEWLYLTQVAQARAMTVSLGWFRSLFPYNNGILIWQLNDCWPGSSWSLIDLDTHGIGRCKPAWYAVQRGFAPRVCNVMPRATQPLTGWDDDAGPLRAYLHNDHDAAWSGALRLRHITLAGDTLAETAVDFALAARSSHQIDVPDAWTATRRPDSFVLAEPDGGERSFWWFAADRDINSPTPRYTTTVDGERVTVTAETLVRDLCFFAERVDPAVASDSNCITLLPGEQHTFVASGDVPETSALTIPPVLRCVGRSTFDAE
ncbi:MAG: glycoside hydrolase family 2 protein [Planctomycetota bacterium]